MNLDLNVHILFSCRLVEKQMMKPSEKLKNMRFLPLQLQWVSLLTIAWLLSSLIADRSYDAPGQLLAASLLFSQR